MNKTLFTFLKSYTLAAICVSIALFSCKHETQEPENTAPSDLEYNPNSVSVPMGSQGKSSTPAISGITPITYSLTTVPDANSTITIDDKTGVISVSSSAITGVYKATIIATNTVNSTTFSDVFTVNVGTITFDANIKPIISTQCAPCHVARGSSINYQSYSAAKADINTILDRITRTQGSPGFMPRGRTGLNSSDIALIQKWKTDGLIEK